jgi:hypothetical protein
MRTQAAHKRERREAGREAAAAGQDPAAEKESRGVSMKQMILDLRGIFF